MDLLFQSMLRLRTPPLSIQSRQTKGPFLKAAITFSAAERFCSFLLWLYFSNIYPLSRALSFPFLPLSRVQHPPSRNPSAPISLFITPHLCPTIAKQRSIFDQTFSKSLFDVLLKSPKILEPLLPQYSTFSLKIF